MVTTQKGCSSFINRAKKKEGGGGRGQWGEGDLDLCAGWGGGLWGEGEVGPVVGRGGSGTHLGESLLLSLFGCRCRSMSCRSSVCAGTIDNFHQPEISNLP